MKDLVLDVTARIDARSRESRTAYLAAIDRRNAAGPRRRALSCGNLAHVTAACPDAQKALLSGESGLNIGIVTAYNDMLSAHQPYRDVPELLKEELARGGASAQVAGGVPAMCDGITQGRGGMELSLFSRDLIAMATGVALSHEAFDGVMLLGVCDKIVPGLLIGALRFGHLPAIFVPAGPMPSGLPNQEKSRVRQAYAEGRAGRAELLAAESASYHAPGTCTFYGTANTNQLLMEVMGLHLPGSSFVSPGEPLRAALHRAAARRIGEMARTGAHTHALGRMLDARAIVNAVVALLATGGSTNHTLHLPAIAAAAGLHLRWDDIAALSSAVPLLTRMYPNGSADVNHFHQAGGMAFLIAELLDAGLLHEDLPTVAGHGLRAYRDAPHLAGESLHWAPAARVSGDHAVLRPAHEPFATDGGLRMLAGNLGEAVIKVSAVKPEYHCIEAPVRVFSDQHAVREAFEAGELARDVIVVVRHQGPRANGMPELHQLTPLLGVLQDRGHRVALVTDGRMSGASGKVPAAIHLTPEAVAGGPIARLRDGDLLRLDATQGTLDVLVDAGEFHARPAAPPPPAHYDCGQDMFALFRRNVGPASSGGSVFHYPGDIA